MITHNCSTTEIVQAIQIKPQWTVWIVAVGWIDSQPANHTANRRSTRTQTMTNKYKSWGKNNR